MRKIFIIFSVFCFSQLYSYVNISGLLSSSDLSTSIKTTTSSKKHKQVLSGQLSQADLSKNMYQKPSAKKVVFLSGLLSDNTLNAVIQFIHTKREQSKRISGLISQATLDKSIVWNSKKKKPKVNLSGFIVQDYLDPDYKAAMKILKNPVLEQEYKATLEDIQTHFKQYYVDQQNVSSPKATSISLPKVCCSTTNQMYTICQKEN